MLNKARTLSVKMTVSVPSVPNFLITPDGNVPLSAVTDDGLRELAALWTGAFLARAAEQRRTPPTPKR